MTMIQKIKKRSGEIVDFEPGKIRQAVKQAFLTVAGSADEQKLDEITENVKRELEKKFHEKIPKVEDVQDIVEKELMRQGFFEIAKAYIIYRYEHAKIREKKQRETLEKIEKKGLMVIKRSGEKEPFSLEKLKRYIQRFTTGYEREVDGEAIALQCRSELYDNIPTEEIAHAAVLAARSFIERDPAYSVVASRILRNILYKEVIGRDQIDFHNLDTQYRNAFISSIRYLVQQGRMDRRMLEFNLSELASYLKPERDELLLYLGMQILYGRYFLRDMETKRPLETPQAFWMRVAMGLSLLESEKEKRAKQFYDVISTLRFVPSTPTLFHSGTTHPQLSSCYLTTINDSLDHIFKSIADNAQLAKWSGGIANDWSNIRATGALIRGTGVESQGVIPFLKIANDTTVAINRSGRRRGATCAYLEIWHFDIEHFLELRKNTGDERRRTHDMNTAVWIPDLFIKRVIEDGFWTLFSPDETPDLHHIYGKRFEERYRHYEQLAETGKLKITKKMKAKELWKKLITMLFETGHPWMTFKDPCNIRSPQDHVGTIHSSNLCTEITLNTSDKEIAVCNLGSVNLAKHISSHGLDTALLRETVETAMRMLDNVIDINFYPVEEARVSNLKHRPVGMGIMGFQDALFQLDIPFESEKAVEFADFSMEFISYHAILTSSRLAQERGPYETFRGSKWDRGIFPIDTLSLLENERGEEIPVSRVSRMDWTPVRESVKRYGMRNSNCLACAPTATIANIAGCFPSIEPIYKNMYVKSNMSGEFTITNHYLIEDLKRLGLWNEDMLEALKQNDGSISTIASIPPELKEKYKEVFDIDPYWLIKIAAHRGKWIDQSQSFNIFIQTTSGKKISDIYINAWRMGLKTTYYLRSMGATGIEKSSVDLRPKTLRERTEKQSSFQQQFVVPPLPQKPSYTNTGVSSKNPSSEKTPENTPALCIIKDPECEVCE